MPNALTTTGLTVATRAELVAQMTAAFQSVYGSDINLSQDTPDGQMMNIWIQSVLDLQDLLVQIYNMFDPDNAIGVVLDQRVAINGIQRQAGTFTVTNITIVTSQALNLYGLDQDVQPVYTVADNAGNEWQLITTDTIGGPGTYVLAFQSATPGAVLTVPNTITIPVTIVLGVTSINNPTTYTTLGVNEESDAALKIRRQRSVALSSQGYYNGLLAALLNINGLSFAYIEENTTGTTNGDGVPGHSIWVIVAGTGANADIAQAIYTKRNAGCGMYGTISFNVLQLDGSLFTVYWDVVTPVDLFIKFTANSLDGTNPPNITGIRNGLVTSFVPDVAAQVNINELATKVQAIDSNTMITSAGFSLTSGGAYTNTLEPTNKNKQFAVSAPDIIILPIIMASPTCAFVIVSGLVTNTTDTVANLGTIQFGALGGYGTLTYSIFSGSGSVNSSTGLFTAAGVGTTIVKVTDGLSNTATCTVTVT